MTTMIKKYYHTIPILLITLYMLLTNEILLSLWLFIIIISSNSIHKIFRYAFLYCSSKNARWLVEKSLKRTNHFACTWIYTPLFMGCGYWVMVRAKNRLFTFQYRKRTWKYDTLMICVIHRRINSFVFNYLDEGKHSKEAVKSAVHMHRCGICLPLHMSIAIFSKSSKDLVWSIP